MLGETVCMGRLATTAKTIEMVHGTTNVQVALAYEVDGLRRQTCG